MWRWCMRTKCRGQNVLTVCFTEGTPLATSHIKYRTKHTHSKHLWGDDRHLNLYPAEYCMQLSTRHLFKQVEPRLFRPQSPVSLGGLCDTHAHYPCSLDLDSEVLHKKKSYQEKWRDISQDISSTIGISNYSRVLQRWQRFLEDTLEVGIVLNPWTTK